MSQGVRELIAALIAFVLVVVYALAVLYDIVNRYQYNVPDAYLAIVVSVVSYFFGQHAATNGAYNAGQIAAQAVISAAGTPSATSDKPTS
jgi:hypothetical protein